MDLQSAEITMFQILGSGKFVIVNRGVLRASGANEELEPGCLLQADASGVQNLEPWDGSSAVLGVLLEGITATSAAQTCKVLARGNVKNEHCYVFNATLGKQRLTPAQWTIARASGINPQGNEYMPLGTISGTLKDEDDTVRNGIVVTLKDADGNTIGTATTAAVTGAYSFASIPVGTYYLNVPATSTYYATVSQAAVVTENATTTAAIVSLFKVGSIAGICTDNDEPANLLEGVSLTCMLVGSEGDPEYGPVLSGADGAYEFPAVRVGIAWKIIAVLAAHNTETVTDITVATDTETELDIVLDVTT
jgi:hypothetical protein